MKRIMFGRRYGRRKKADGSYTVEAAFILPIIIFVIIACLYMGFIVHDNVRIQTVLKRSAGMAQDRLSHSREVETGDIQYRNLNEKIRKKQVEKEIGEYIKKELEKGVFLAEIQEQSVKISLLRVSVSVTWKPGTTYMGALAYLYDGTRYTQENQKLYEPAETLRRVEGKGEDEGGI